MLAQAINEALVGNDCIYYGPPERVTTQEADIIFVGFWADKGSCSEEIKKYLSTLENKKIFLFGTAGFGGSLIYFDAIMTDVKQNISASNTIMDSFMCKGKMPSDVLKRHQKQLKEQSENINILNMIDNYKRSCLHPDTLDLMTVKVLVKKVVDGI